MLVDIPAAQHKTIFFIVSSPLCMFLDASSLSRAAARHNRFTMIVCKTSQKMKPVSILQRPR
jgi:hypothetical protein